MIKSTVAMTVLALGAVAPMLAQVQYRPAEDHTTYAAALAKAAADPACIRTEHADYTKFECGRERTFWFTREGMAAHPGYVRQELINPDDRWLYQTSGKRDGSSDVDAFKTWMRSIMATLAR